MIFTERIKNIWAGMAEGALEILTLHIMRLKKGGWQSGKVHGISWVSWENRSFFPYAAQPVVAPDGLQLRSFLALAYNNR